MRNLCSRSKKTPNPPPGLTTVLSLRELRGRYGGPTGCVLSFCCATRCGRRRDVSRNKEVAAAAVVGRSRSKQALAAKQQQQHQHQAYRLDVFVVSREGTATPEEEEEEEVTEPRKLN